MLTWQCDVTLGLTWQDTKCSRRVERVGRVGERGNWRVRRVADINGAWMRVAARAREIETSAGAWRRV